MLERELCATIIEFLTYKGVFCWRVNSGAMMDKSGHMVRLAKAGTSDILGVYRGHFVAIEVKLPKTRNTLTLAQTSFLADILRHGGISGVATSPEEAWTIITTGVKI